MSCCRSAGWFVGFVYLFFSPSLVSAFWNWRQYVWRERKDFTIFQTSFSTKKEKLHFGVLKERIIFFSFFFQDEKHFRKMSVLLENEIHTKIERFNREWKIEFNRIHLPHIPTMKCWQPLATLWVCFHLLPCSSASAPGVSYLLHRSEGLETPKYKKPKLELDMAALV